MTTPELIAELEHRLFCGEYTRYAQEFDGLETMISGEKQFSDPRVLAEARAHGH